MKPFFFVWIHLHCTLHRKKQYPFDSPMKFKPIQFASLSLFLLLLLLLLCFVRKIICVFILCSLICVNGISIEMRNHILNLISLKCLFEFFFVFFLSLNLSFNSNFINGKSQKLFASDRRAGTFHTLNERVTFSGICFFNVIVLYSF